MYYSLKKSVVTAVQFTTENLNSIITMLGGEEEFKKKAKVRYYKESFKCLEDSDEPTDIMKLEIWDGKNFLYVRNEDYVLKNSTTGVITSLSKKDFENQYEIYKPETKDTYPFKDNINKPIQVPTPTMTFDFSENLDCVATNGCKVSLTTINRGAHVNNDGHKI